MSPVTRAINNKQLITTAAVAGTAFLLALPIGAGLMPRTSAASAEEPAEKIVAATVCAEDASAAEGVVQSATTSRQAGSGAGGSNTSTHTHQHTNTQTSSNNSGSTAQVGRDGIAVAVGDVLSNNDILSDNTTTVSPSVNLLNGASILNHNKGTLLDLNLL